MKIVSLLSYQRKQKAKKITKKLPVAMRQGETPVTIPNTMVKTLPAENTWLETAWEDRWLPDSIKRKRFPVIHVHRSLWAWMAGKQPECNNGTLKTSYRKRIEIKKFVYMEI